MITLINILIVVALFNVIIFVHELGHFLAARWRGLQIDRFQIWFGKPIWKKEINGVQYGLGWLPAGGFVALPQMAPMESVEGKNREEGESLPPIKPKDKIIVAFAGPLFSFGLALVAALFVMWVGKPRDFIESSVVGHVPQGGVAEKAGMKVGDEILAVNGEKVDGFAGSRKFNSVDESVKLSEGKSITFLVKREGKEIELESEFNLPPTKWYKRKKLRTVGIEVESKTIIGYVDEKGPAAKAGLQLKDEILAINDESIRSWKRVLEIVEVASGEVLKLKVLRGEKELDIDVTPVIPENAKEEKAKIGIGFGPGGEVNSELYYPGPFEQVGDSVRMMWVTLAKVVSPNSDVGPQHLSGPVGIGKVMYHLMQTKDGWRRLLFFMVLFNVNLAILNMLPLPILDGGHIVLAFGEILAGRPIQTRLLEAVQFVFFFLLIGLFLFITSKDLTDDFGFGGKKSEAPIWPKSP